MTTPRPAQSLHTRQGTRWGLKTKLILSMLFVGVVPLVASRLRASTGAALEGLEARPDGAIDAARLWRLGGAP